MLALLSTHLLLSCSCKDSKPSACVLRGTATTHSLWRSESFLSYGKPIEVRLTIRLAKRWLEKHPQVAWVSYLGLESHGSHKVATELFRKNAFGGVLSFGVKGDAKVASSVVDNLKLASNLANVGTLFCVQGGGETGVERFFRGREDPRDPSRDDDSLATHG